MVSKKRILLKDLILEALEKSIDGYVRVEDFLYNTHIYARGYDRPLKKSNLSLALKQLREKGYINTEKDGKKLIVRLSQTGQDKAILMKVLQTGEWDGKWRVVVFDIPEDMRKVRNIFRARLKIWRFTPWQKSVWVSKKDLKDVLRKYIRDIGIKDWVKVFESDNLE
ncbi:hypothetical protein HYW44_01600 [Candidatus Daviesbacteria bacterium]|nr:hypothetical protein [Candidatus Daviesbacteria bacterium]